MVSRSLDGSSNSSRIGFKGKMPAGKNKFLYQFESEVNLDDGGGTFTTRNSFLGLEADFGRREVGRRRQRVGDVLGHDVGHIHRKDVGPFLRK